MVSHWVSWSLSRSDAMRGKPHLLALYVKFQFACVHSVQLLLWRWKPLRVKASVHKYVSECTLCSNSPEIVGSHTTDIRIIHVTPGYLKCNILFTVAASAPVQDYSYCPIYLPLSLRQCKLIQNQYGGRGRLRVIESIMHIEAKLPCYLNYSLVHSSFTMTSGTVWPHIIVEARPDWSCIMIYWDYMDDLFL